MTLRDNVSACTRARERGAGVVANTLVIISSGVVGSIDWLDGRALVIGSKLGIRTV